MTPEPLIRTEQRGRVLLAVFDMPGRTMNVFSDALMDALEALIDHVEADSGIDALVLTSGKSAFIAGADLEMVRGYAAMGRTASRAELHATCGRLGRLFVRLEALTKPTVAALNGLALGGGLEVAMACRLRVAADNRGVQLGLPEVKLGLLPGAGGTQRLPRLIGIEKGLELLLSGKSIGAAEAHALGLVDAVVPAADLLDCSLTIAAEAADGALLAKFPDRLDPGPFDLASPGIVRVITRHFGHQDAVTAVYPAYDAIVRCVVEGAGLPLASGSSVEMDRFVDLMQDEVAGNMVSTLFLWRQKADKQLAGVAPASRFAVTGDNTTAQALKAALVAAKGTLVGPGEVSDCDVRIQTGLVPVGAVDLVLLSGTDDKPGDATGIYLARSRDFGTALEIITNDSDSPGARKALALARQLRATPFIHSGNSSLLARLAHVGAKANEARMPPDAVLAALARAAQEASQHGGAFDPQMADVASVVGGVFPAYAGGPFTWMSAHGGDIDTLRAQLGERAAGLLG